MSDQEDNKEVKQTTKCDKTTKGDKTTEGDKPTKHKKPNAWIQHVKFIAQRDNLTYRDALKIAKDKMVKRLDLLHNEITSKHERFVQLEAAKKSTLIQ